MQPGPIGEPGYAPASKAIQASPAVILPSFVAPSFRRMNEPAVGPVASNASARDIISLPGRPDFFESAAATGGRHTEILPPKPPPISIGTTFTLETGTRRSSAVCCRALNEPCVLIQTVILPSAFHRAVALCGSM